MRSRRGRTPSVAACARQCSSPWGGHTPVYLPVGRAAGVPPRGSPVSLFRLPLRAVSVESPSSAEHAAFPPRFLLFFSFSAGSRCPFVPCAARRRHPTAAPFSPIPTASSGTSLNPVRVHCHTYPPAKPHYGGRPYPYRTLPGQAHPFPPPFPVARVPSSEDGERREEKENSDEKETRGADKPSKGGWGVADRNPIFPSPPTALPENREKYR